MGFTFFIAGISKKKADRFLFGLVY